MKTEHLSVRIQKEYQHTKSWRKVAAKFGITGGMAYRIAVDGHEPKEPHIRHTLGLPALIPAPACPKCGKVPIAKHHRCAAAVKPSRPPRIAVSKTNMASAARTLARNLQPDQLKELAALLKEAHP